MIKLKYAVFSTDVLIIVHSFIAFNVPKIVSATFLSFRLKLAQIMFLSNYAV